MSRITAAYAAKRLLPFAAIAASLLIWSSVFAHAEPASIFPGDGANLTTAPTTVTMTTTEQMSANPGANTLSVHNMADQTVSTSPAVLSADRMTLTLTLPAGLPTGSYMVMWATVSGLDGDAADGSWSFTYDPSKPASAGSTVPAPDAATPTATATATATATTTATATATATVSATPSPTASPTARPTVPATAAPTTPTAAPASPTQAPASPKTGTGVKSGDDNGQLLFVCGGLVLLAAAGAAGFLSRKR